MGRLTATAAQLQPTPPAPLAQEQRSPRRNQHRAPQLPLLPPPPQPPLPLPRVHTQAATPRVRNAPAPPPRVQTPIVHQSVSCRTQSNTTAAAEPIASRTRARSQAVLCAVILKGIGVVATATAVTASTTTLYKRPRPTLNQPQGPVDPIAFQREHPITPAQAAAQRYPRKFLESLACPVTDEETCKTMEYRKLRQHPQLKHIWETSCTN